MSLPSGQAPASGSAPTDLDLINRINQSNDSAAVSELVHRHTGAYMAMIDQYTAYSDFRRRANIPDLRDDKFLNIFKCAQTYDPARGMQFGTYVMESTKWLCKSILTKGGESVELVEHDMPASSDDVVKTAERDSALEFVHEKVDENIDPMFKRVFELRHQETRLMPWRDVAAQVNMTHEGARKLYAKNMERIKKRART